ncbi:MAG: DUF6544 family protein [Phormidesmis sp.]
MAGQKVSLSALWQSAPQGSQTFQLGSIAELCEPTRRYLTHAIAPFTPLAHAVRLKMHGEIKLKGWQPFQAQQVICWQQGMLWQATVWMKGLPIFGWDRLVNGEGAMQWKLLGLFPVMKASGSDITRSAVGRMQGEYVWLPSAFLHSAVHWSTPNDAHACTDFTLLNETTHLELTIAQSGQLQEACFKRWGNPDDRTPHYENFGIYVEDERTFSGYTIPTRIRAGWYFGSSRFESEGEFFRATVDQAVYR